MLIFVSPFIVFRRHASSWNVYEPARGLVIFGLGKSSRPSSSSIKRSRPLEAHMGLFLGSKEGASIIRNAQEAAAAGWVPYHQLLELRVKLAAAFYKNGKCDLLLIVPTTNHVWGRLHDI